MVLHRVQSAEKQRQKYFNLLFLLNYKKKKSRKQHFLNEIHK